MTDLLTALQSAERGSRELDAKIAVYFGDRGAVSIVEHDPRTSIFSHQPGWCRNDENVSIRAGDYTTSIDAALALVERCLPGWSWLVRSPDKDALVPDKFFARLASPDFDAVQWEAGDEVSYDILGGQNASATAPTPPLALVIALVRAKEAVS
jgi:hypothetical protein